MIRYRRAFLPWQLAQAFQKRPGGRGDGQRPVLGDEPAGADQVVAPGEPVAFAGTAPQPAQRPLARGRVGVEPRRVDAGTHQHQRAARDELGQAGLHRGPRARALQHHVDPVRLDQFLALQCADLSRSLVRRAIDAGEEVNARADASDPALVGMTPQGQRASFDVYRLVEDGKAAITRGEVMSAKDEIATSVCANASRSPRAIRCAEWPRAGRAGAACRWGSPRA